MERNKMIALIRKECIKANPDIVELRFGCALLRPSGRLYKVIEDMTWGGNTKEVWINSVPFGSMSLPLRVNREQTLKGIPDDNGEVWKIIGRPIRLADVLLAMNQKHLMVGAAMTGGFFNLITHEFFRSEPETNSYWWNLRADDLDQQSDAAVQFIYNLLKV